MSPANRVEPTAPDRYRVAFTADAETHALLRRAQDLLGHQVPDGDLAAVFGRALRCLVIDLERKRTGGTKRPVARAADAAPAAEPESGGQVSRHVPARVRHAVWERDGGRCTFTDAEGNRCTATRQLELDHLRPFAVHREHSVDGIVLKCRAHNRLAAERYFGREHMDRFRRRSVPGDTSRLESGEAIRRSGEPVKEGRKR